MSTNGDSTSAIGAPSQQPNGGSSTSNTSTSEPTIRVLAPASASDAPLVAALTHLVNSVYGEAERSIYKTSFERTSAAQIEEYIQAGQLAAAFPPANNNNNDNETPKQPIGCIFIKKLSPTTGEFGMLAVSPTHRSTGLGRALVRFAEDRFRQDPGVGVARLELLVPVHFEHAGKTRLQAWYARLGYVMTELRDFGLEYPALNALLAGPTEYRVFEKTLVAVVA
ncbi:hypothetical protein F4859DRAFT_136042 [Xylaria cf. heliscus]|nr:hypothetical protein F4859DRAFT_136042 [Xylaria cf. heliscus]